MVDDCDHKEYINALIQGTYWIGPWIGPAETEDGLIEEGVEDGMMCDIKSTKNLACFSEGVWFNPSNGAVYKDLRKPLDLVEDLFKDFQKKENKW